MLDESVLLDFDPLQGAVGDSLDPIEPVLQELDHLLLLLGRYLFTVEVGRQSLQFPGLSLLAVLVLAIGLLMGVVFVDPI